MIQVEPQVTITPVTEMNRPQFMEIPWTPFLILITFVVVAILALATWAMLQTRRGIPKT